MAKCHSQSTRIRWSVEEAAFRASDDWKCCDGIEAVIKYCEAWNAKREKLAYEIDGVVIKVNSTALQNELGFTAKARDGPSLTNIPRDRKLRW